MKFEIPTSVVVVFILVLASTSSIFIENEVEGITTCTTENVVCADVLSFNRTRPVRREDTVRNVKCYCPGTSSCPSGPEYSVFHSRKHIKVLCNPISTLRPCEGFEIAEELHITPPENNYNSFYKLNCICPRHQQPGPGKFDTATATAYMNYDKYDIHYFTCSLSF